VSGRDRIERQSKQQEQQVQQPDRPSEADDTTVTDVTDATDVTDVEASLAAMLAGIVPPQAPAPATVPVDGGNVSVTVEGTPAVTAEAGATVPPPAAVDPSTAGATAQGSAATTEARTLPEQARASGAEHGSEQAHPEHPERPETSRAPEERLGEQLRALSPRERSEVASAWNRAGGRFEDHQPSKPEQAHDVGGSQSPVQEPPPAAASPAPQVPVAATSTTDGIPVAATAATSAETAVESAVEPASPTGTHGARAERSATERLEGLDRDTVQTEGANGGQTEAGMLRSTAGAEHQRQVEFPASRVEQSQRPVEARDPQALVRGLADSVRAAVRNGNEHIRLVLNPPELGHLDVRVTTGSGGVRVEMAASTADATDLIRQHLPSLVSSLEARDLRVDRMEVRQALGTDLGSLGARSDARQPGDRGTDRQPQQARPEWSGVAALERAAARAVERRSDRASSRLLDLVA
jgi:flagellar hook-length control protein FliK